MGGKLIVYLNSVNVTTRLATTVDSAGLLSRYLVLHCMFESTWKSDQPALIKSVYFNNCTNDLMLRRGMRLPVAEEHVFSKIIEKCQLINARLTKLERRYSVVFEIGLSYCQPINMYIATVAVCINLCGSTECLQQTFFSCLVVVATTTIYYC